MSSLAPIVLFVYNRPEHTRRTLESLLKCELADESQLFIYADGPKPNADEETLNKINETRKIIREKKWCGEVQIFESDVNRTHPVNVVERVTEIVNRFGRMIMIEDDLILGTGVLRYLNDALKLYEQEEKVMHISAYTFPVFTKNLPETFFNRLPSNWGWATWARAWKHFEKDPEVLFRQIKKEDVFRFDMDGSIGYYNDLKRCVEGPWKAWDIRWYASIFVKNGLCLHPRISLVRNIGNDGSGMHCDSNYILNYQAITNSIKVEPIPLVESAKAARALRNFNHFLYNRKLMSVHSFKELWRKILPTFVYNYLKKKKNIYLMARADKPVS